MQSKEQNIEIKESLVLLKSSSDQEWAARKGEKEILAKQGQCDSEGLSVGSVRVLKKQ